jgi:hypothetical protein
VEVTACVSRTLGFNPPMSVKEQVIASVAEMPEDMSWSDLAEHARLMAAIEEARASIRRGEGVSHEEMKREVRSWFQK